MTNANVMPWTSEQVSEKLGISSVAFPGDRRFGREQIDGIGKSSIRRIEICGLHPRTHYDFYSKANITEIRQACDSNGIVIPSIHGPGVPTNSEFEQVRKSAVDVTIDAIRTAEELGATIFVGHFGTNDYARRSVEELLQRTSGSHIVLVNENGRELSDYVDFCEEIASDRFGIVVDVGHTRDEDGINPFVKKENARETLAQCGRHLRHLHLHDFKDGDHYAPFTGDIQWTEIFLALGDVDYSGEFMFEAARPSIEEVIRMTEEVPNLLFAER